MFTIDGSASNVGVHFATITFLEEDATITQTLTVTIEQDVDIIANTSLNSTTIDFEDVHEFRVADYFSGGNQTIT